MYPSFNCVGIIEFRPFIVDTFGVYGYKTVHYLDYEMMQQFSHTSTDFNIHTTVAVGRKLMSITVGELASANFYHDDFHGIIKDIADPMVLSTILDFERVSVWDMPLDEPGMFDSICSYFKDNDFEVLAELLAENKARIFEAGMPKLADQWDESIQELLYTSAAKSGKIRTSRQEKHFELILRKANPLRHRNSRHPLAKHFVSNVWPEIHHEMRSKMSASQVRNVSF